MWQFAGEARDSYINLYYLRARWLDPSSGRFTSRDVWPPDYRRPTTLNEWLYAYDNPTNRTDPTGLSPDVECNDWDWYFRDLCERSNGSDTDTSVLDAREQLFTFVAVGGLGKYWSSGGAYGSERGYAYASMLLLHFLEGNGQHVLISLPSRDPFVVDPGITRATTTFGPALAPGGDEAEFIVPLLHDFVGNYVKPVAQSSSGFFSVGPTTLRGAPHYFNDPKKVVGLEPRARDRGYWAAFGHVTINGEFTARGYFSCRLDGYVVGYSAKYFIEDQYKWYPGRKTPFPFGPDGSDVYIPHEWEISLVTAGRAKEFDFTVKWTGYDRLLVKPDFSQYRVLLW